MFMLAAGRVFKAAEDPSVPEADRARIAEIIAPLLLWREVLTNYGSYSVDRTGAPGKRNASIAPKAPPKET